MLLTIVYKRPYGKNQEGYFIGANGTRIYGAIYGAINEEGKGITFKSNNLNYEVAEQSGKRKFDPEKAIEVAVEEVWNENTSKVEWKEPYDPANDPARKEALQAEEDVDETDF